LIEGEKMDWKKFMQHINSRMPEHARPIFIRVLKDMGGVNILDQINPRLKQEGFSPQTVKDPLFYLDPQQDAYLPLTPEIYQEILENKFDF